jgi:hypothetical protein
MTINRKRNRLNDTLNNGTRLKRRLSFELGTHDKIDRKSRKFQRKSKNEELCTRITIMPIGSDIVTIKPPEEKSTKNKFKNIHTISLAAHGKDTGGYFIGDDDDNRLYPEDLLTKIDNMFPNKQDFPKEIVLNCCYSKKYVKPLQALIKERKLPIQSITYHAYQDGDGQIYPNRSKDYDIKNHDDKKVPTKIVTQGVDDPFLYR